MNVFIWTARRLRQRLFPGPAILLYHSVSEVDEDPLGLRVSPTHFAEHLEVLRRHAQPMKLAELTSGQQDRIPKGAVVLTFDDGYADNLCVAKPLLKKYGIPATVFVATSGISSGREFWWDEAVRMLGHAGSSPELSLQAGRKVGSWDIRGPAKGRAPRSIQRWLLDLPDGEREKALEQLRAWAGCGARTGPAHRTLSEAEVKELASGGLVEVGSHAVTHRRLARLNRDEQRREIAPSKAGLEAILGEPVSSFAYPHGSYDAQTVGLVREAGFLRACSTEPDFVHRSTDPFILPRLTVRDWDGDTFSGVMRKWLAM